MNKDNLPKTFGGGNGFFKRTEAEQNSSVLSVDDLSITTDGTKSILCSKMPVTPGTNVNMQPAARMSKPKISTILPRAKLQGNIRTSQIGNKLNDLDFGVTSTPLHGRVSLRQKFIDEQLSPIMQEFNGGRRSLQSRIPVPQNRLLGPVVGGTISQSKKPLYTKFNQEIKEPNPPMISRSDQRVSFESHVIEISNASVISKSNSRVLAMKMCQQTVIVNRNIITKGNLKCTSLAPVVEVPSLNKVNSNCAVSASKNINRANMMKVPEEKEPSKKKVLVSCDKSKSILKKPLFREDVLDDEEEEDDDIFGISKCTKRKLSTVNSGTTHCENDSDKQLHQSGDEKIVPALKGQTYIDNEKGKMLKERSPNIIKDIFDKTENDIQQLTDSKKVNKKVTDKKRKCSEVNRLKNTVKNDNQYDNKQDKNHVYVFEMSKNDDIVSHGEKKPKSRKRQNDKDVENQNSYTEKYNDVVLKNIEHIYRTDLNTSTKEEQNLTNTNSVKRMISSKIKKGLVKKTDVSEAKEITQALKSNKGRKKTVFKKDSVQKVEDINEDIKFKSENNNIDTDDDHDHDDGKTTGKGENGKGKNLKESEVYTIKVNNSENIEMNELKINSIGSSSKMEKGIKTTKVAKRGPRSKIVKITEVVHDVKQNLNEELKENAEYKGENQNVAVHTYTTKQRKVKDRKVNNNSVDNHYKEKFIAQEIGVLEDDVNKDVTYTTIKRTKQKVPEAVSFNNIPANESDRNIREEDVPKKVQSQLKSIVNKEVEPAVKRKAVATTIQVDKINESIKDVIQEKNVPKKVRTKLKSKINEKVEPAITGKEIATTIQVDNFKELIGDVIKEQEVPNKVQTKLKSKINEHGGSPKGKEVETIVHVDMVKETIEDVIAHYGFKDEIKLKKFHTEEQKTITENEREQISEKNKLELSRKRLITNEASTIVEKKKRKITVLECNDEEEANDVESSQGSRRSSRIRSRTTGYCYDTSSLQNSIETEKRTGKTSNKKSVKSHNLTKNVSRHTSCNDYVVRMPPGYGIDEMPCFSSINPRLKPVCSGVRKCTGIIVTNKTSGGHIFIQPGKSYENMSSNDNMFLVQKGPAHVKIYKTSTDVETNNFFFVPSNVPFKVKNQGPKKVVLCFVKTLPKT